MITDRISIVAAGCAFYATLALFPELSMLVFVYGLIFDPVTVESSNVGARMVARFDRAAALRVAVREGGENRQAMACRLE